MQRAYLPLRLTLLILFLLYSLYGFSNNKNGEADFQLIITYDYGQNKTNKQFLIFISDSAIRFQPIRIGQNQSTTDSEAQSNPHISPLEACPEPEPDPNQESIPLLNQLHHTQTEENTFEFLNSTGNLITGHYVLEQYDTERPINSSQRPCIIAQILLIAQVSYLEGTDLSDRAYLDTGGNGPAPFRNFRNYNNLCSFCPISTSILCSAVSTIAFAIPISLTGASPLNILGALIPSSICCFCTGSYVTSDARDLWQLSVVMDRAETASRTLPDDIKEYLNNMMRMASPDSRFLLYSYEVTDTSVRALLTAYLQSHTDILPESTSLRNNIIELRRVTRDSSPSFPSIQQASQASPAITHQP